MATTAPASKEKPAERPKQYPLLTAGDRLCFKCKYFPALRHGCYHGAGLCIECHRYDSLCLYAGSREDVVRKLVP